MAQQNITAELILAIIESTAIVDTAIQRREISEQILPGMMPGGPPNRQIIEKISSWGWERRP
jgi:hypothetical protein